MTASELVAQQWRKFSEGIEQALATNRFLQRKWQAAGIAASSLHSLDDLVRVPFTDKEELLADQQEFPPYGSNLTEPVENYVRLHQTSGTSGRRLRWLDTPATWNWILNCWYFIFRAIGIDRADRLFFPFSFGPFLGFWAAFDAATRLGNFVLPGGGLTTSARLHLILDHRLTIVFCTPTYALRMAEVAEEEGIDLAGGTVRALVLAGEPGASNPVTRARIESAWGARVFDHSGMTEIGSLGIEFAPFPGKLFLLEDQAIAEFLVPGTDRPAPPGELAEMVLTNLGRWASPLIRYRTGDLVLPRHDLSPAGFPFVYLDGGILGRVDDMVWIKGNNIYPSAIEAVLRGFPQVCEFSIEAIEAAGATSLSIDVEPFPSSEETRSLSSSIAKAFQDRMYFRPDVRIVSPGSLPRYEMKASRFRRIRRD